MSLDLYEDAGRPEPLEIRLKREEKALEIDFADGHAFRFSAEYLRVESPSAEVRGHSPSQRQWVPGKLHVGIERIEPVGNYAIRLFFDDGHSTGIFSWSWFYDSGIRMEEIWETYCSTLDSLGLSREP